jgi:pimeloyl-ACP methyl ester carboxylesterase
MKRIPDAVPAAAAERSTTMPELEGVRHRFLDLPGLRMHVAEAGAGEPVLLLHGALQHWWAWRGILPGLAARYRVLAPDLRGCGWTDAPAAGYTRDAMTADLVAALDACGVGPVRLVSTDLGVLPGYALCYDHPDRVLAHVAIGVPPPSITVGLRHVPAFLPLWHQEVGAIPGLAPALFGRGGQELARHMLLDFSPPGNPPDLHEVEGYLARLRLPGRARAVSAQCRRLVLPELARITAGRYRRARLSTPTLVLAGSADRSFPPAVVEDLVRTVEPHVDHVEVGTVRGAAHYVAQERPEQLLAHLLRFFAAMPAGR